MCKESLNGMAKHLNKVIDIENNTLAILHIEDMFVILQCVFHGIRLLRLRRIGCRETTNFFCPHRVLIFTWFSLACNSLYSCLFYFENQNALNFHISYFQLISLHIFLLKRNKTILFYWIFLYICRIV